MKISKNEIIANFIYAVILVSIVLLFHYYLVPITQNSQLVLIVYMIEYMIAYNSIRYFSRIFSNWKYYSIIYKIVEFPNNVYPLVIKPYYKMSMGLFVFFGVTFMGILFSIKYFIPFIDIKLQFATKLYILITLYTILMRSFANKLIKKLAKLYYKHENQEEHLNLTLSIVNEERIRYLIYFSFFIILFCFSILSLENLDMFVYKNIPSAILSSFATFIAYDRLINNWSLIKFNPKRHWELLVQVYEKDPKYVDQKNYLIKKEKNNISN